MSDTTPTNVTSDQDIEMVTREIMQLMVEDAQYPGNYVGITVELDWWLNANQISKNMLWQGLAAEARPKLIQARLEAAQAALQAQNQVPAQAQYDAGIVPLSDLLDGHQA